MTMSRLRSRMRSCSDASTGDAGRAGLATHTGRESGQPRALVRLTLSAAIVTALALHLSLGAQERAQEPPAWPDTFVSRLQALALIQTLNADILGGRSATASLERWCRDHRLADDPRIIAQAVPGANKVPTVEQRRRLRVSSPDEVTYRRVRLRCGDRVLSEADNWYVPRRLTADMNRQLADTETPFGRVVQPLEPYRQTFAVTLLWSPLPEGWTRGSGALPAPASTSTTLEIPAAVFEHRAVLYSRDHQPFSEVHEVYQRQILAFRPPSPRE